VRAFKYKFSLSPSLTIRSPSSGRPSRAFYIFANITNGKDSKAILRIAPTYFPLLFANTFKFALFADVAAKRVNFLLMWHPAHLC
jgi:hypothetical protein